MLERVRHFVERFPDLAEFLAVVAQPGARGEIAGANAACGGKEGPGFPQHEDFGAVPGRAQQHDGRNQDADEVADESPVRLGEHHVQGQADQDAYGDRPFRILGYDIVRKQPVDAVRSCRPKHTRSAGTHRFECARDLQLLAYAFRRSGVTRQD